jgi:antitoxin VapB
MSLNIKHPDAHRLARELAEVTGQSLTDAVTSALARQLEEVRVPTSLALMRAEVAEIQSFVASLPVLDDRSTDEILEYAEDDGLPR